MGSSLQLFDPWTEGYVPGALFEEAAEHCGLDDEAGQATGMTQERRTALIADLKAMDADEIASRREEARRRYTEILARLARAGYEQTEKGLPRHP